jgi:tetraacyldisaccharide 4'-kinase
MSSFKKRINFLLQYWYRKTFLMFLLLPFSWLFRGGIFIRLWLYRNHIFTVNQFPVPIIVVGNITVGGNGKTPFVIWLVEFLKKNGYRPGIVSRGYGGKATKNPGIVQISSDPEAVGEEAILLKNRADCPVVIGPNRSAAVTLLLQQFDCNIVVSDDGLQHYALGRDIEVALVDGARREGNGYCLPAGPLREPKQRLTTVDFVVVTNGKAQGTEYEQHLQTSAVYQLIAPTQKCALPDFQQVYNNKTLHAVAGIGCPERFFATLKEFGLEFVPHIFPDHYFFKPSELDYGKDSVVIMTEKDAIKYVKYADARHWCVPVTAQVSAGLAQVLLQKVTAICLKLKK